MTGTSGPLQIAIGGGKGGVGKSMIAANLACAMAELGFRVVLVDADLGSANQHTLFGIDRPGTTLQALIERKVDTLEECVVPTSVHRVFLVPGSGAIVGAANVAHAQKLKLIRHIKKLDADVVLVDCGAGTSYNVVDLFAAADLKLLVASPQLTSIQNAYGFLKSAVYRSIRGRAKSDNQRALLTSATDRSETEKLRHLAQRVAAEDWDFGLEIARIVDTYAVQIIGNQLESPKQTNVLHAFARMVKDFLALETQVVSTFQLSPQINRSVTERRPFFLTRKTSTEGRALTQLAEALLEVDVAALRASRLPERPAPKAKENEPAQLPGPLSRYLRRHERKVATWPAIVERSGRQFSCRFRDVSAGGASFEGPLQAEVGDRVLVSASVSGQTLSLRARVRYIEGGRFGVEFSKDQEEIGSQLLAHARSPRAA